MNKMQTQPTANNETTLARTKEEILPFRNNFSPRDRLGHELSKVVIRYNDAASLVRQVQQKPAETGER